MAIDVSGRSEAAARYRLQQSCGRYLADGAGRVLPPPRGHGREGMVVASDVFDGNYGIAN
jgi:hypothetical protein